MMNASTTSSVCPVPSLSIQIRQGHQDHPLRTTDAKGLGPKVADFLEVHVDGGDRPGELSDKVLNLAGRIIRAGALGTDLRRRSLSRSFTQGEIVFPNHSQSKIIGFGNK
jgi:hypothetical protein